MNCPTVQEFVGVQDPFGQVEPRDYLMEVHSLRADNIVEATKKAGRSSGKAAACGRKDDFRVH